MVTMPTSVCPTCSFSNPATQQYCARCGRTLSPAPAASTLPAPACPAPLAPAAQVPPGSVSPGWIADLFNPNLVQVRGVVGKKNTYSIPAHLKMGGSSAARIVGGILVLMVVAAFLPQLLGLALAIAAQVLFFVAVFVALKAMANGVTGGAGLGINPGPVASQVSSGVVRTVGSAFKHRGAHHRDRELSVTDLYVNDRRSGRTVLVRIEGVILEAPPLAGHEIDVEGTDHNGTIIFKRGFNLDIGLSPRGSEIRVASSWPWGW